MSTLFNTKEYKRYRGAYVSQCTIEHLMGLMMTDAFFAKLVSHMGLSDMLVGIISSFATLSFIFQFLSIYLVQSKMSTKNMVVAADTVCLFFFMFIYFIPFFSMPDGVKKIMVTASVMIAYAVRSMISSLYFKWANTYVSPENRAVFSAKKECISLFAGLIFAAGMGFVIDKYEGLENIEGGFLFIGITMLILNIGSFVSYLMIKDEKPEARNSMRVPMKEVFQHMHENRCFKAFLASTFISSTSAGMITGFLGIYKIKELAFSVLTVQFINIAADLLRMAVSVPAAKYSTKYGYAKGICFAEILTAFCYFVLIFTAPATRWLMVVYTLVYTASLAMSYQNSQNIGYILLPEKYMAQAMAVKSVAGGIVSFVTAIIAGYILNAVQSNNNVIFGMTVYGQQVLSVVAFAIKIPAILILAKYLVKPIGNRTVFSDDILK